MTTAAAEQTEAKASIRRQQISRRREVRLGIQRFEKLMNAISGIETALKLIISENPKIESFILILGATPLRPLHVYELSFLHGSNSVLSASTDFTTNKAAEALARKAVRALITNGAGSGSYPGPSKLFLLVKAPSSFNLPLHFLPKRDFKYSKKIVPVRLRVKCKSRGLQMDAPDCARQNSSSISLRDSLSEELIWFQCRHVVKGIACATQTEE
ncbi:uncharacterized protein LOC126654073 isoform X2 [Mercurialis annua]|nr:uncharacterized protein LOC126654073 isoform X2 [Mercurialis annua]